MPLSVRLVEPVHLSNGFLCTFADNPAQYQTIPLMVANTTLSKALLQLTSLVRHANDIFCDLSDECQKVYDRTVRLKKRIVTLSKVVENLNDKEEPIPSKDIKKFHKDTQPFGAKHGYDCNLFTIESRPQCVNELYSTSEVSPSEGLSTLDGIRKDGWSGSTMFKLWPVAIKDINISTPDFNTSRKKHPVRLNKTYKTLRDPHRSQTVCSFDQLNLISDSDSVSGGGDQLSLSQSQPSILVSIDTSGASFERMCSFRRSLRDSDNGRFSNCTRRHSISGLPESIMHEVKNFENQKKNSGRFSLAPRRHPRTYSFNDLGPLSYQNDTFSKYFDEIDAKKEEKNEWDNIMKQSFFSKFISCSRSQSALHSNKSKYNKSSKTSPHLLNQTSIQNDDSECFDINNLAPTNSGSLKQCKRRSSFIGDKIKHLIKVSNKSQRKSLDLDLFKVSPKCHEDLDEFNLAMVKTLSMPEGISEATPQINPNVDAEAKSDEYYNFANNTLPRAQAKKYDFPWESLPKDWTTSVRLREISKRRKEERQSSSGNWSASTSARQSMESDRTSLATPTDGAVTSSASFYSLGQDSGQDSATETEDRPTSDTTEFGGDETSTLTGEASDRDSFHTDLTKLDTETWLKNLAVRTCSQDNTSSSSVDSINCLTKPDFLSYDLLSSSLKPDGLIDDEVSSIYSLDQDGFYTSFHSDSGLRRNRTIIGNRITDLPPDCLSEANMANSVTVDSVGYISGTEDFKEIFCVETKEICIKSERDQTPTKEIAQICQQNLPSPTDSEASDSTLTNVSNRNSLVTESSYSESDHEIIYKRLRNKTVISPTMFPSWCIVSSSGSDEDMSNQLQLNLKNNIYDDSVKNKVNIVSSTNSNLSSKMKEFKTHNFNRSLSEKSTTISNFANSCSKNQNEECNTLPRSYLASKKWNDEKKLTSSWPRTYSSWNESKKQGILKSSFRKDSNSGPKMQKSLNFSPYVNMLQPGDFQTQHCLLSDLSSEDKNLFFLPEQNSFTSTSSIIDNTILSKSIAPVSLDYHKGLLSNCISPLTDIPNFKYPEEEDSKLNELSSLQDKHNLIQCKENKISKNCVIIKKPQPHLANQLNTGSGDIIHLESIKSNVKPTLKTLSTDTDSDPLKLVSPPKTLPSSPYAVSFVSENHDSKTTGNCHNQDSMCFTINKSFVNKSTVVETVVINTARKQDTAKIISSNPVTNNAVNSKKSLTTFTAPSSNRKSTVKHSFSGNTSGSLSTIVSNHPSSNPEIIKSPFKKHLETANTSIIENHPNDSGLINANKHKSPNNSRNRSYRVAMHEESEEPPKRLDSYRKAIISCNNIFDESVNRSDSYRVATQDSMADCNSINEIVNRSDSYRVAMEVKSEDQFYPVTEPICKDIRRMGITGIDQLKVSNDVQFNSITDKGNKSISLKSKMSNVFGNGKSDSQLLNKSQNSKKSHRKNNGYISENSFQKAASNLDKKQSLLCHIPKQETDLQNFKKLVSHHTTPFSSKISAVEVLKKKTSQPFSKDTSSENGSKGILGGLFQRPLSWGGTSKVNPKMSTYVSFDTIFEDKETISNASSVESLRSPSLNSIKKIGDPGNLHLIKFNYGLKPNRKSLIEVNKNITDEELKGRKRRLTGPVDEKAVQSVLDSIKTTIKSMTSRTESGYKQQCSGI